MWFSAAIQTLALLSWSLLSCVVAQDYRRSAKRGLIFIPNAKTPEDNSVWTSPGSDLTWYYNYGLTPSSVYANNPSFQFVPMLFTAASDTTFLDGVKSLISGGTNVSYVLSYNEPDGDTSTGGTNITPQAAALSWVRELEPLRALGVKVGAPAVTGAETGFTWLSQFFAACNCTADFIPIHWYGNFAGLASHIGQVRAAYPNLTIWITEYAYNNASLTDTQSFFNSSADYFDRIDYIARYSYFGSFRSSQSNVGPNVSMLDKNGKLTDIGSWYLGGAETNNIPTDSAVAVTAGSVWWALFVVGICFCVL